MKCHICAKDLELIREWVFFDSFEEFEKSLEKVKKEFGEETEK